MIPPRPLGTRDEVAKFLRVTTKTLDNWRRAGEGPPWHRLGEGRDASVRYFWDEVEAWVRGPKGEPPAEEPDPDRSRYVTGVAALAASLKETRVEPSFGLRACNVRHTGPCSAEAHCAA